MLMQQPGIDMWWHLGLAVISPTTRQSLNFFMRPAAFILFMLLSVHLWAGTCTANSLHNVNSETQGNGRCHVQDKAVKCNKNYVFSMFYVHHIMQRGFHKTLYCDKQNCTWFEISMYKHNDLPILVSLTHVCYLCVQYTHYLHNGEICM